MFDCGGLAPLGTRTAGPDHSVRVWDVNSGIGPPANTFGYRYDCYICHGDSPYSADLCVAMADFFRTNDNRLQVSFEALVPL